MISLIVTLSFTVELNNHNLCVHQTSVRLFDSTFIGHHLFYRDTFHPPRTLTVAYLGVLVGTGARVPRRLDVVKLEEAGAVPAAGAVVEHVFGLDQLASHCHATVVPLSHLCCSSVMPLSHHIKKSRGTQWNARTRP